MTPWDDDKSTATDPDNPTADEQLTADEWDGHVADGHFPSDELNLGVNGNGDPVFTDPQNADQEVLRYDRGAGQWVLSALRTDSAVIANELGLPEFDDVANAPQTQNRLVYATGDGASSEGIYKHDGSSYTQVGGGGSSEWQEDGSGNIVPIDGETVGDGTTSANHQSVKTASVNIDDGGSWEGATVVKSAPEFANAKSQDATIVIPTGTTIEVETNTEYRIEDDGLSVWIQEGATVKMADGADLDAVLDIFAGTSDCRIRLDGVVDANRANQSAGRRSGIQMDAFDQSNPASDNLVYGAGEVIGTREMALVFLQSVLGSEFRGIEVRDFAADASGQPAGWFTVGGSGDTQRPIDCGFNDVKFLGDTWDSTGGYGDAVTGSGGTAPPDEGANFVHNCYFRDIPHRGIQSVDQITCNRVIRTAVGSGGGDAIAHGRQIQNNVVLGSFDGNDDNGIILDRACVCSGNRVEGFNNHGIRTVGSLSTNLEMLIISGNILTDNNQGSSSDNANLRLTTTDNSGGAIVKENVCYGDDHDPVNNIVVENGFENARVTENIAQGATTEIDDSSPATTTVADNITI